MTTGQSFTQHRRRNKAELVPVDFQTVSRNLHRRQERVKRVSNTANIIVLQLLDLFSFLGLLDRNTLWSIKHTSQTT
jgi:hypothetical protein